MTLLEKLQSHKGGLLRIKSDLFWYDRRAYDNVLGRICMILDVSADAIHHHPTAAAISATAGTLGFTHELVTTAAHLLIDGSTHWVWVAEKDVEVLSETR